MNNKKYVLNVKQIIKMNYVLGQKTDLKGKRVIACKIHSFRRILEKKIWH